MKLPPFTLVHKLTPPGAAGEAADRMSERRQMLEDADPDHAHFASGLNRNFRLALVNTSFVRAPLGCPAALIRREALPAWEHVLSDLERRPKVITVGIWELGTRAGYLPWLIERLNAAQPLFTFFKVQAAIPSGIVSRPERVQKWAAEKLGHVVPKKEREAITDNVIAEDFFGRAERVRKDLGVELLVGVTPSMVAGDDEGEIYWNHLATSHGRTILASAYGMQEHSRKAKRPFEVAVALVAIAQLLATLNSQVEYHDDVGCLFDYNETHATIVKSLRKPMIEEGCLGSLSPRFRDPALALVAALGAYERPESEPLDSVNTDEEPEPSSAADEQLTEIEMLHKEIRETYRAEILETDIPPFIVQRENAAVAGRPPSREETAATSPATADAEDGDDEPAGPSAKGPSGGSSPPTPVTA